MDKEVVSCSEKKKMDRVEQVEEILAALSFFSVVKKQQGDCQQTGCLNIMGGPSCHGKQYRTGEQKTRQGQACQRRLSALCRK